MSCQLTRRLIQSDGELHDAKILVQVKPEDDAPDFAKLASRLDIASSCIAEHLPRRARRSAAEAAVVAALALEIMAASLRRRRHEP
jgi:hypothetical protein